MKFACHVCREMDEFGYCRVVKAYLLSGFAMLWAVKQCGKASVDGEKLKGCTV